MRKYSDLHSLINGPRMKIRKVKNLDVIFRLFEEDCARELRNKAETFFLSGVDEELVVDDLLLFFNIRRICFEC